MAYLNSSIYLRNDSGATISLGTLDIAPAASEQIWDTVDYVAGVVDNFAQVLAGIATFNEEVQAANLVMVVDTVDQTAAQAFSQLAELVDVYNELSEAQAEFSILRLEGESTLGLDLVTPSGIDLDSDAALLPGRSGGQTLIGGTAAGEDLVLQSTSNATRGNVLVRDDELRIFDDADPTKLLAFQLSGLTASTTRTVTMADADVNLADIALNNAHRGSTSNPHGTTLANLTDTDLTGIEQGAILYRDDTQWVVLGPGSAGQLLQSGGTGANPSWTTASGTGDVVGPASSTDYAVALFNGETGKLLRNSTLLSDANGNLFLDADGSTPASPRILGFSNFSTGEAYRWQSTANDGIQSQFNGAVTYYSWNSMVFRGNRNDVVPDFDADAGVSYLFESGQAGEPNMVVRGADSQTADLQQWVDDPTSDTVVASMGPAGDLAIHTTQYDLLATPPTHSEGLSFYDSVNHALVVYNEVSDTMQQLGQEHYKRVHNATGVLIPNGSAVYLTGAVTSGVPNVALAQANAYATAYAVGVTTHDIADGSDGYVTQLGEVGMDTSALSVGRVYVSATVAGGLTNTPPTGANIRVEVGEVIIAAASGELAVNLPRGLPLSSDKSLDLPGDLYITTDGATLTSPRIVGGTDMTTGEGMRYQFGDEANGWQNGYDQAMQMWAYHTIILQGDRTSGTAPSMETTSNIGVLIRNTTAGSPALVVDGASSQTAALQQWRTSAGTMLAQVTSGGAYDANNHDVTNIKLPTVNGVIAHGAMGSTETINWTLGGWHSGTNSAACTISFTAPSKPCALKLFLTNGGAYTITWPAAVDWVGSAPPTLTPSGLDIITFLFDGTTYFGVASKNFG
jgi:hypothetical protein